jgi:hypothetical protein
VLLHFLAQLHSTCPGPLSTEATEGSSQVVARTAAQLALQALQPTGASPCAEVSSLSAAITAAAGGSSDNTVEVDTVLELLGAAWSAQRAVEQQQLERVLAHTDMRGKGITNQEEFAGLVKHVRMPGPVQARAHVCASQNSLRCRACLLHQRLSSRASPKSRLLPYTGLQSGRAGRFKGCTAWWARG